MLHSLSRLSNHVGRLGGIELEFALACGCCGLDHDDWRSGIGGGGGGDDDTLTAV